MDDLFSTTVSPEPARPESLTVDFYDQGDTLAIHKKRGGGPALFLLLWLTAWTVGCVVLAGMVINEPSLGNFAFAIPFWASWLFVAAMLVWMLFGKETLLLRQDKALFLRTALITLRTRGVPREEILGFRECRSTHTENDEHLWGIEMKTLGKPVRFAFRLPDRERAWLIYKLNQFLGTTNPDAAEGSTSSITDVEPKLTGTTSASSGSEVLSLASTLEKPPTDSEWQFTDEINAIEFVKDGRFSFSAFAGLLFVNAFWNGIVSVFVMVLWGFMPGDDMPEGGAWWGLFVFLIPFEVIGLLMFAGLCLTVLEPFSRRQWRFEQARIIRQISYPLVRRTRAWEVIDLNRLELRNAQEKKQQFEKFSKPTGSGSVETSFKLAFVTDENVDLCSIGTLTEGEARWMAGVVLQRRRKWFDG